MPCGGAAECGICAVPFGRGWKLACKDGPVFELNPLLEIREADYHINDAGFARLAAEMMDAMVRGC